ncbi:MAG: hypothetical protein U0768_13190 [Anaerolineae bacterium]
MEEAQLKGLMVGTSALVVGTVDSSKFGALGFSAFALPHEIDRVITDDNAPPQMVAEQRPRHHRRACVTPPLLL